MPKMKTHKGAKKRFKLTGTGKLRRRQAGLGHIMEKFSATRERRLTDEVNVSKADEKNIMRLLGKR